MCVNLSLMLMLLFLSGAVCSEWNVTYHQQDICAVKGSSVVIPCSFYYPKDLRVTTVMWGHERSDIFDGPFIFDSDKNETDTKFKYIGNKQHNCSFNIHNIEHNDTGKYAFRFITDTEKGKWTGTAGSTLKVVDLNVSVSKPNMNDTTKEGDSVILTCLNSCDGDHLSSAFTWFKDGEPVNEGPVLDLSNMSSTDSGNYSCSLKTHTGAASRVINIHVEYGPKNTSVSVRPSMGNITLICSSHANPPVEDYTWFKIDESHVLDVGHKPVLFSADGGQYFCSATNKHGSQNSSVVAVKIEDGPKNTSVSVRPSMEVEAGTNITLICSSHANPPVEDYTWFKIDESHVLDVGHQPELFSADGGQYFCSATNKHGSQNSSVVNVKIKERWPSFNRDVPIIILSVAVLLTVITAVAVIKLKKTRPRARETNSEEDREDAVYVNMHDFHKEKSRQRSQGMSEIKMSRAQETNCEEDSEDAIYVNMPVCEEKQCQQRSQGSSRQATTMMRKV